MAEELDPSEFWLPPEFLTDDDILMDFKPATQKQNQNREIDSVFHFPFDYASRYNPHNPHSGLSSPVESMVSSESEEEDYLAGLTRKMASSTLLDDLWKTETQKEYKHSWGMSVSPQSTLCGCKQGSSRGSPNCPSQVSSPPPSTAAGRKDTAWNLLYAAAGEVARMRIIEEANSYYQDWGLNPISAQLESDPNPSLGFQPNQSLAFQRLQIAKQLRRQQLMKQAVEAQTVASPWSFQMPQTQQLAKPMERNICRPANLSSGWPTLQQSLKPQQQQAQQQQPGSGMRAVFLGNSRSDRKIGGTGVFLPRRVGGASETRKKSGCSTVLLPDRVVQALNLNLEAMEAQPQLQSSFNVGLTSDFDAAVNYRSNALLGQLQKKNLRQPSAVHSDLRLPQEWTY